MKNKLLLSTLVIASTINLSKVSASQTVIDYPTVVATNGILELTEDQNGYLITAPSSIMSEEENASSQVAKLTATKPVTYSSTATLTAEGKAVLDYQNVTFNNGLTLTANQNSVNPEMTVSGNMKIAGAGTINTGNTAISFTGDTSELDISDVSGVTFTKFRATGKDATNKLTINYGDANTVKDDYETYRTNLDKVLTSMDCTGNNTPQNGNIQIQDIWVTANKNITRTEYNIAANQIESSQNYSISINYSVTQNQTPGTKFINDSTSLTTKLTNAGVEIVSAAGENPLGDEDGDPVVVGLDFGADINKNITGTEVSHNSAGNVFNNWEDIEYDLDSNTSGSGTGFTFNMDIKPDSAKTLQLKSSNPNLATLTLNGEQNNNLTIKLKSAGIKNVEFSPLKASYSKIDTSEAFDTTKDSDNLNIKVLDYNSGTATERQNFTISTAPTIASEYGLTDTNGDKLDDQGNVVENDNEQSKIKPTYSLNVGKNLNVILTSNTFKFNSITVAQKDLFDSQITVGDGATLKL